jgi:hypothetical protein
LGRDLATLSKLVKELSRRRVFRTVIAYLVVIWALSQGASELFPHFGLDERWIRTFIIALILGIPVVALLSWRFNLTLKGVVPDPFSDPGILADEDLQPGNASDWARNRHEGKGAGYLTAIWTDPGGEVVRRQFFEPCVIGRDPANDIQLADRRVSRVHAVLYAEDGAWKVRDINSSNGTFLDGRRVSRAELPAECQLRFHDKGPALDLSIHKAEETALTRDAMTRFEQD